MENIDICILMPLMKQKMLNNIYDYQTTINLWA